MKKFLIFISLISIGSFASYAQNITTLSYSIGAGVGELHKYISKASFRGIGLDYRYQTEDYYAVGCSFGWNVFYQEKLDATYVNDNVSISGQQFRYSNNFPMSITGTYFVLPGSELNPYLTVGAGTMYTLRNTQLSLFDFEQDAWNFLLQPEVGMMVSGTDNAALHLSVKYVHGFKAGNDLEKAQSYFSFNIGVAFK